MPCRGAFSSTGITAVNLWIGTVVARPPESDVGKHSRPSRQSKPSRGKGVAPSTGLKGDAAGRGGSASLVLAPLFPPPCCVLPAMGPVSRTAVHHICKFQY